jgi:hypothetical protein
MMILVLKSMQLIRQDWFDVTRDVSRLACTDRSDLRLHLDNGYLQFISIVFLVFFLTMMMLGT